MTLTLQDSEQLGREHWELELGGASAHQRTVNEIRHVERVVTRSVDHIGRFWSGYDQAKAAANLDELRLAKSYGHVYQNLTSRSKMVSAAAVFKEMVTLAEKSKTYSYTKVIYTFWDGYDEAAKVMLGEPE